MEFTFILQTADTAWVSGSDFQILFESVFIATWKMKLIACSPCGLLKASFKYDEKESTANDSASLKSQFSFCDVEERVCGWGGVCFLNSI